MNNNEEIKNMALDIAYAIDSSRVIELSRLESDHIYKQQVFEALQFIVSNGASLSAALRVVYYGVYNSNHSKDEILAIFRDPSVPTRLKNQMIDQILRNNSPVTHPAKAPNEIRKRLYLIRNERNGYYKIGISRNPFDRVRTLQSEEPELSLIGHWEADIEKERYWHNVFKDCRLRGEWFSLSEDQVGLMMSSLAESEKVS